MARAFRIGTGNIAHIVSALVDTLVGDQHAAASEAERIEVRAYVLATIDGMPDYVRLGFCTLAHLFEYAPVPRLHRRFSRLDAEARRAQMLRWRRSPFGFQRAMIAFYSTFSAYGLYSATYPAPREAHGRIAA